MHVNRDFVAGVKTVAPLVLGIAPFGLITGVAAVDVGLSPLEAMGMSVFIFAGTSQLAAIDLIEQGAAPAVIILTIAVINVRLAMYSASLSPHLQHLSTRWQSVLSYLLTDPVYALSVTAADSDRQVSMKWYVFGLGFPLWVVWQVCTAAGIALGATVPEEWRLTFVIPLTFLAILVPELKERTNVVAAATAGVVAVAGAGLSMNLGLILGATVGILVGTTAQTVTEE